MGYYCRVPYLRRGYDYVDYVLWNSPNPVAVGLVFQQTGLGKHTLPARSRDCSLNV